MSDAAPKKQTKPQMKRVDGPPKPPTRVTLGLDEFGGQPPGDTPFVEMATAVTNAQVTWSELLSLNGGGGRSKRESLELSLDRNIVLLGKVFQKLEKKEDQKIVTETLCNIREYRLRHPRTDASDREQAERAQKILDEIPEV